MKLIILKKFVEQHWEDFVLFISDKKSLDLSQIDKANDIANYEYQNLIKNINNKKKGFKLHVIKGG